MKLKLIGKPNLEKCCKVSQFCCCLCSLKSGTIFIAVLFTINKSIHTNIKRSMTYKARAVIMKILTLNYFNKHDLIFLGSGKKNIPLAPIINPSQLPHIFSLFAVSAVFSYIPSFDFEGNITHHGSFGYEFGAYGIYTLLNIMKISCVIWFLVNLSLLFGALGDRVNFVIPWVGWHLAMFFLQFPVAIWIGFIVTDVVEAHLLEVVTLAIAFVLNT
ncbi:hypothetical protein L9F63_008359, partial [Diploptera punctata]